MDRSVVTATCQIRHPAFKLGLVGGYVLSFALTVENGVQSSQEGAMNPRKW